jgi:predicted dehydrogenase
MSQPLGIAIVGCGGQGTKLAEAFVAAGCRIVCWFDPGLDEAACSPIMREAYRTWEYGEVVRNPAVDAVVISSYDAAHANQVLLALSGGKHVLCEKPLCRTRQELKEISLLWKESGKVLFSNFPLRYDPHLEVVRQAIFNNPAAGPIFAIDGEYRYGRKEKITHGWRSRDATYSAMLGGAIHLVDQMLTLAGETPERVYAVGNGVATAGTDFMGRHDYVAATYTFPSGLIARITVNLSNVGPHEHVLNVFQENQTFLYRSEYGLRSHLNMVGAKDGYISPEVRRTKEDKKPSPYADYMTVRRFVDAIESKDQTLSDKWTRDEFRTVAWCIAADESLHDNRSIWVGEMEELYGF